MQVTYLSTFISGTGELVEQTLKRELDSFKTTLLLDGLIVFTTKSRVSEVASLRFLNNTFIVVKQFDNLTGTYFKPMIQWTIRHGFKSIFPLTKGSPFKTFRLILSDKNEFVSYNKHRLREVEDKIAQDLNLKIDKQNPDTEAWIMYREEKYGFVLFRVTNESDVEHRDKGSIRTELANLMCYLANPTEEDILLDPFAGYGTILYEMEYFPHEEIIGFERERGVDFFDNELEDASITKIITDPPWGIFDDTLNVHEFYHNMFKEFNRVLVSGGEVVLLVHRNINPADSIATNEFEIVEKHNILVSGKKASLYKMKK